MHNNKNKNKNKNKNHFYFICLNMTFLIYKLQKIHRLNIPPFSNSKFEKNYIIEQNYPSNNERKRMKGSLGKFLVRTSAILSADGTYSKRIVFA